MLTLHTTSHAVPTINVTEVRWAAAELSTILQQIDADSPVGLVIRHAHRELASLARSADSSMIATVTAKVAA